MLPCRHACRTPITSVYGALITLSGTRSALVSGRPRTIVRCLAHPTAPVASKRFRSERAEAELVPSDAQRRTIYALSTPPGKAGVAVIRVSGPNALQVWTRMVMTSSGAESKHKARKAIPEPWRMYRCKIVHPENGESLDDGIAVFFRGPKSFTTEDVVELHIHSGRAIISSVLSALSHLSFCRQAERGEFTRRAFEGGHLDLTQVEALKDLIDAETDSQRKAALKAAGGATRARYEHLREEVIKCLALVEALIDFGEGEEIEEGVYEQARTRALGLYHTIQHHLSDNRRGEILRSGIRLAIFGPPNAGKSSLLNFLAQREAAIVTPAPGTTRDILELSLDIDGLPVIVADTAGLRHTDDIVEKIGVERARQAIAKADVSLCVLALPELIAEAPTAGSSSHALHIPPAISSLISEDTFLLLNKTDLVSISKTSAASQLLGVKYVWEVSLTSGEGTQSFLDGFGRALQERYDILQDQAADAEEPLITHSRHRAHLESALKFLRVFLDTPAEDVVFGAEELRYAAQAVGKISGLIDVEDVLDAVFRDFCIGK